MGTPTPGIFGPYFDFVKKLQGEDANPVQSAVSAFDSLLKELNQIAPVAGRVVMNATGAADALVRLKALSEIERQLFLQFLVSELMFFKQHRIMKADDIFRHVEHDRQICEKKQAQITGILMKMFNIQGIDSGFTSALIQQRGDTVTAWIKLTVMPKEVAVQMTVDDFLHNRETAAVRKILEQTFEYYASDNSVPDFDAHGAWIDLKERWAGWASKYGERMKAFHELWAATGGSKDVGSNAQGYKIINDYYQELYKQIENGNGGFARLLSQVLKADPWN